MNEQVAVVDGVSLPLLVSSVIGGDFVHAFATRGGGVSVPPFEALNLGLQLGDAREAVLENRRRLLEACGIHRLFLVRQVHGADVVQVNADDQPAAFGNQRADAIVTDVVDSAVGVFTADCVPLLFADPPTGACAAVHAGWRGVLAGVALQTVTKLAQSFGVKADTLRVATGPAIGACCFEVGPEVVAGFESALPEARAEVIIESHDRCRIDLRRALRRQLEGAGLLPEHVDTASECTRCDPAGRFFSYRRSQGRTGLHISMIARRS